MKKAVGLWIDHREAVIITVADEGEAIQRIRSDVEPHGRFSAHAQRLEPAKLSGRIVGIETVDKLTDQQMVAKIRQHFLT